MELKLDFIDKKMFDTQRELAEEIYKNSIKYITDIDEMKKLWDQAYELLNSEKELTLEENEWINGVITKCVTTINIAHANKMNYPYLIERCEIKSQMKNNKGVDKKAYGINKIDVKANESLVKVRIKYIKQLMKAQLKMFKYSIILSSDEYDFFKQNYFEEIV